MTASLKDLIRDIRREAERADFPVDREVYERAGKEPAEPILFAGTLEAPACIFGRDLGKDEVKYGQPLVGAGGKLVREGILRAFGTPGDPVPRTREDLEAALKFAILTNTVPYKPPGNKAYADSVKERFRPFVARLLVEHWGGRHVITLGTEAFQWFARYGREDDFAGIGKSDQRFKAAFPCRLEVAGQSGTGPVSKELIVMPLPHPSPLNRKWIPRFPALLDERLREVRRAHAG
ncbi:Uracil DNA glycosylase superfamily protein [Aquisphaera giovannonii]|uniref:Uracil DNA glycosylase superfamily protein n=1 Tax=Aquisphaera giovannonii TaxID=406548 RepID=A0A5B9VYH0_9BACT|nr:uracil-DNA glycosylase family protein [Aquisphaera giovannonii]QEH33209.1 Uracil DNA glycosylase superfamily protein [Aquisphaera giovannonii]